MPHKEDEFGLGSSSHMEGRKETAVDRKLYRWVPFMKIEKHSGNFFKIQKNINSPLLTDLIFLNHLLLGPGGLKHKTCWDVIKAWVQRGPLGVIQAKIHKDGVHQFQWSWSRDVPFKERTQGILQAVLEHSEVKWTST